MFAMSAAEFSLYLGIVVIISVLGLAFWTWTQFQDTQRHLKTLEKIIYNQAASASPDSTQTHTQVQHQPYNNAVLPQSSHVVETSEDDNDSVDETNAILNAIEHCENDTNDTNDVKEITLPESATNSQDDGINDSINDNINDSIEAAMDAAAASIETLPAEALDSFFPTELASVDMSDETDKVNLAALSRKDLLDLAKSKGLKVQQNIKKQELIELLSN